MLLCYGTSGLSAKFSKRNHLSFRRDVRSQYVLTKLQALVLTRHFNALVK